MSPGALLLIFTARRRLLRDFDVFFFGTAILNLASYSIYSHTTISQSRMIVNSPGAGHGEPPQR